MALAGWRNKTNILVRYYAEQIAISYPPISMLFNFAKRNDRPCIASSRMENLSLFLQVYYKMKPDNRPLTRKELQRCTWLIFSRFEYPQAQRAIIICQTTWMLSCILFCKAISVVVRPKRKCTPVGVFRCMFRYCCGRSWNNIYWEQAFGASRTLVR